MGGVFRTKNRHYTDKCTFTVTQALLSSPEELDNILQKIRSYYGIGELDTEQFIVSLYDMRQLLEKSLFITDTIPDYKHRVFEGSQGLMLDEHIGYMPHCTPSDITPRNIQTMGYKLDEVFLVTRAYQTRHGNGPMTNEEYPVKLTNNEKETCIFNRFQGGFRTSVLDLDMLEHAKLEGIDAVIPKGTKVSLIVTCVDQIGENFQVTHEGLLLTWQLERFVKYIGNVLNINGDTYINDSPRSLLTLV